MGSALSAGSDNDELTDNLCKADYIRTERVERQFRAVDRGEYILPANRLNAYKDQAWRNSHLHLSAPCIYSEVLEGLNLYSGLSFLNLGSGTGYLSTLVGLVLGCNGVNHGVEYYDDVIEYANKKLEDFKRYSGAIDEFDFCEPKFMQGNCFSVSTERRYDRVYVGAACPMAYDHYLKNFVKIGGILVMPFHDQLLQLRRVSEETWNISSLLPVSFATLIMPKEGSNETIDLIDFQPNALQSLCRTQIRNILRNCIEMEHPDLCCPKQRQKRRSPETIVNAKQYLQRQALSNLIHHQYDSSSESDHDEESNSSSDQAAAESLETAAEHQRRKFGDEEVAEEERQQNGQGNTKRTKLDWLRYVAEANADDDDDESSSTSSCDTHVDNESRNDDNGDNDEDFAMDHDGNEFPACNIIYPVNFDDDGEFERCVKHDRELCEKRRTVDSPFTGHMCTKINDLPLPTSLKSYLNFYRF